MTSTPTSLYERAGGERFFRSLIDRFYAGVASDPVLVRLYPEAPDLSGARERLTLFLIQYWGGPATYSAARGHPRLRLRHMPFAIGPEERDHWLAHMTAAVDATVADAALEPAVGAEIRAELLAYFRPAAEQMRNDTGLPISSARPRLG